MKPRIGITCSPAVRDDRSVEEIDESYVRAVIQAGGLPLLLPVLDPADVPAVTDSLDGILLAGGADVDPARYGATAAPEVHGVDGARDDCELALARVAVERDLPLLGICRGAQVLNVALGGTLVQHLPDLSDQKHCARDQASERVHTVGVLPESRLRTVVGHEVMGVNSLHHQAVDRPGLHLRAVAWAGDGTVEAVEGTGSNRALGVQWHPELLVDHGSQLALFQWLVREAALARPLAPAAAVPLPVVGKSAA